MDINVVFLTGRLGSDPEIKYLPSGTAVANMNVATGYGKKVNDEWQNETVWHTVKVFGNTVESYISKLKKGDFVVVEGTIREDRWEDSNGNKRSKKFVLAKKVTGIFTGETNNNEQDGSQQSQTTGQSAQANVQTNAKPAMQQEEDDLPF